MSKCLFFERDVIIQALKIYLFSLHMNHPLIITVAYFGSMGKSKIHVSKGLLESIQAFISGLNPQCNCKMEIKRKRLMVGKIP